MKWLTKTFARLTGISTPLGGLSWSRRPPTQTVRTFQGTVQLTSAGNKPFISFLKSNCGRIVFLRAHLDACVATEENYAIIEAESLDIDRIASGSFSGIALPLPNSEGQLLYATFYFLDDHPLRSSAGGTGVVIVEITGFFEVSRTAHGGPSQIFHLREFDAPLEFRVDFVNQPEAS